MLADNIGQGAGDKIPLERSAYQPNKSQQEHTMSVHGCAGLVAQGDTHQTGMQTVAGPARPPHQLCPCSGDPGCCSVVTKPSLCYMLKN